ncbi:MAG: radical SAM protein [Planctomycetota bacterium]
MLVQWMATLRCPLSCPHCLAVSQESGFEDMPLGVARSLVRQIAEMGVGEFLVTGGEPLARADLPGVIDALAEHKVSWSLNTACMPSERLQRAIESYPPAFTAVSLDGPAETHDAFRGRDGAFDDALRSIRYFAGLDGCSVAAGTTVTTSNFDALQETFGIVMQSGASHWGIHLLVQEGRAAERKDLFLSRRQLSRLLRFVAKKRTYFPVTMADEFGYCGDWEPLVRDLPLTCGAGRTHCVVLPDGEVVPCTTLDRSASAGNINERPLRDIWADGFAELRNWEPKGRCAKCDYAPACEGGCWLQRRHGTKCYRDVWHVPEALKTAAGVAVCLGALAASPAAPAAQAADAKAGPPAKSPASSARLREHVLRAAGDGIEGQIVLWYGRQMGSLTFGDGTAPSGPMLDREGALRQALAAGPTGDLAADPAGRHFAAFTKGELPEDIAGMCKAVRACLDTKEHSLALAALLWRNLSEPCLNGDAPAKRTAAERKALRDTLAALRNAADAWRKGAFDELLKPYLARGWFPMPYAAPATKKRPPPPPPWRALQADTSTERWAQIRKYIKDKKAAAEFVDRHPYAESMMLALSLPAGSGCEKIGEKGKAACGKDERFGVHDLLVTSQGAAGVKMSIHWTGEPQRRFEVVLPNDAELTYADIVKLVGEQHQKILTGLVDKDLGERTRRGWYWPTGPQPFLLPAVLERRQAALDAIANEEAKMEAAPSGKEALLGAATARSKHIQAAELWLADFWMF